MNVSASRRAFFVPIALAAWLGSSPRAHAQTEDRPPPPNESVNFGFGLHRFQDDFGLGVQATTPSFLGHRFRFTAAGGVAWFPHAVDGDGNEAWVLYGHTRLVVEAGARIPATPIRLYGFGGPFVLILPNDLSSQAVRPGGIGGFGFEYNIQGAPQRDSPAAYFVELGGVGTGALADEVPGHPIMANGFVITAGFRAYL